MVYGQETSAGKSVDTVDVPLNQRNRFCISDQQVMDLARQAVTIEQHYERPMDIEWALDGDDGKLYIVQARPETVVSQQEGGKLERFQLREKGRTLITGRAIGQRIGRGTVKVVMSPEDMDKVLDGDILVTDMTDPDWEPIMKRASAIVTNRGGRTCHAAIIARELGIPAVVGCGDATQQLREGTDVTVSCAEGDTGHVYDGLLDFDCKVSSVDAMPGNPIQDYDERGQP